jgi:activator of HSP90 ATPase
MSNIHQEVVFAAPAARLYRAIIDLGEFSKVTGAPAEGGDAEGAAFSAFGGHITGRHVELVPNKLIVQAWRAKTWPAGRYSIVRFELRPEGSETRLVFDHDGFPDDQKEHLSKGWHDNYWEPIRKYLG